MFDLVNLNSMFKCIYFVRNIKETFLNKHYYENVSVSNGAILWFLFKYVVTYILFCYFPK
jgi:hypothetical protein